MANIHKLAEVQTDAVGEDTYIWQYAVVLKNARIGKNCNINCHTFIENDVIIGDNVTVKPGVFLWDGITVQNNVFIGPNATFTNDRYPRSKVYPEKFERTVLEEGCTIGANATVLGGITIGSYAIVGAGSVVTKDVPAYALIKGSPARITGWVDELGNKLVKAPTGELTNNNNDKFTLRGDKLIKL